MKVIALIKNVSSESNWEETFNCSCLKYAPVEIQNVIDVFNADKERVERLGGERALVEVLTTKSIEPIDQIK